MSKDTEQKGELYQKFEKYIWKYSAIDSNTANIGMDTVNMILDAARAEHPPEWNKWIIKQPEYIRHDKHIDMHDMWQRYAWEMIDWFKRWFGVVP